jgi:PAS domain-containing protein
MESATQRKYPEVTMPETFEQDFGSAEESIRPAILEQRDTATHTINLNSLFTSDVYSTASFDLGSLESTPLAKLLEALPIPAFLIDPWYSIAFANQNCGEDASCSSGLEEVPFLGLLAQPQDSSKAKALADKAISVLEKAFETRLPQRVEAVLRLDGSRIWCRLHIRTVRIASQRYLLVLAEDVTAQKAQQRLGRDEERRLRREKDELQKQVQELRAQLTAAK